MPQLIQLGANILLHQIRAKKRPSLVSNALATEINMPIKRVKKFLETDDLGITHSLGIESEQLAACINEINKRNIKGVFGCPVFGFKETDLNFLNELPSLIQVWFWEINLSNIEGLYTLKNLKYFGVHDRRPPIDFAKFPELQKAVWQPVKKDKGIEELSKLKQIDIWRYRDKEKSYKNLHLPKTLEKLELNWCNPESLNDLKPMPDLKELQIHYCRNLVSINSISKVAPNLKRLIVTRCANLSEYSAVERLDLDHLHINIKNKIVANNRVNADC